MPFIRFNDGTDMEVKPEMAKQVWEVLNGDIKPNDDQVKFCERVKKVYMNWRNPLTPDSYIEQYKNDIFPVVVGSFMCTRDGIPTRPEYSDKFLIQFCDKWGLTVYGRISEAGRLYAR